MFTFQLDKICTNSDNVLINKITITYVLNHLPMVNVTYNNIHLYYIYVHIHSVLNRLTAAATINFR